jgi:uncharacterized protein (DUF3084 family)
MASEQSRRAGNEFRALQEEVSNRRVRVDASVHNLVDAYNRQVHEIANLKYEIAKRDTVIAIRDHELSKKVAEIHQLEFKLQDQIEGAASLANQVARFQRAYWKCRDPHDLEYHSPYYTPPDE